MKSLLHVCTHSVHPVSLVLNTSSQTNSFHKLFSLSKPSTHQPHDKHLTLEKSLTGKAFVRMSGFCFFVSIFFVLAVPLLTCSLKNQCFAAKCFDLGVILGAVANVNAPLLSSNAVDRVLNVGVFFILTVLTISIAVGKSRN